MSSYKTKLGHFLLARVGLRKPVHPTSQGASALIMVSLFSPSVTTTPPPHLPTQTEPGTTNGTGCYSSPANMPASTSTPFPSLLQGFHSTAFASLGPRRLRSQDNQLVAYSATEVKVIGLPFFLPDPTPWPNYFSETLITSIHF